MADRSYHRSKTQGVDYVKYDVSLRSYGATHPVFIEGDAGGQAVPLPVGQATGSYLKVQRGYSGLGGVYGLSGAQNPVPYGVGTGITGCYFMLTRDPFVALVTKHASLSFEFGNANYFVQYGQEFQEPNGIWVIPFQVYLNAAGTIALADLPSGAANRISVTLCFRNSNAKP